MSICSSPNKDSDNTAPQSRKLHKAAGALSTAPLPPETTSKGSKVSSTRRYFLMKSEPDVFSVDDLAAQPNQTGCWEGVRNYQARNLMRDHMHVGDQAFFYHSSCKVPGIVGIMEVSRAAYPDHFQWDKGSKYYDAGSDREAPRWWMVDVTLQERLEEKVPLEVLREEALKPGSPLAGMALLQKGSRLSVQPVREEEWKFIHEKLIMAPKGTGVVREERGEEGKTSSTDGEGEKGEKKDEKRLGGKKKKRRTGT